MAWVASTYAARSIVRNTRRTILAVVGIAVGCTLAVVMESINRGRDELFARMGAYGGAGHLRIVPAGWRERRDVRFRLAAEEADVRAALTLPGVRAVTTRARAQVLLAMGTRVVPVEMTGVDPAREPATFKFVQNMARGEYLAAESSGAIVVGQAVAQRLRADLDDEIVATAVGRDGDIASTMFRIRGIVTTGSQDVDATICQVALPDLGRLTGLAGAGEVTLVLADWRETDVARDALARQLESSDEVMTWGEINPELQGHMKQDAASSRFVSVVLVLIVLLGVASAQLAAVLERRREFAVLAALGMSTGRLVRLVLQEAVTLGLTGAVMGLLVATPLVWRLARSGLDLRPYMGASYTFQGAILEPVIYGDMGSWIVPYALTVGVGATVVASLYPAWFAARTDPAVALRVAQ
ncbi:MAG: FtsX-like permease family protein [Vicinamibacterales bacterium]